jgi:bisphosphoglycerate-dependent phosphoglycerate mutase
MAGDCQQVLLGKTIARALSETLKDCSVKVRQFFNGRIIPKSAAADIFIQAHGNLL